MSLPMQATPLVLVPIEKLHPNTWNHNKVSQETLHKIRHGLKEYKQATGTYLPLLVRPHQKIKGHYEIVDGEHRYLLYRDDFKETAVPAIVQTMSDSLARKMTVRTNYLHGDPDPLRYAEILADLVKSGETLNDLSEGLPETAEELRKVLDQKELDESLKEALEEAEEESANRAGKGASQSAFVELKFTVPLEAAEIIEREVTRLGDHIGGKNSRGRALEFMAVSSSQSPLPGATVQTVRAKKPASVTSQLKRRV
jgi:ParB/RepB/Spo0J family partition protein